MKDLRKEKINQDETSSAADNNTNGAPSMKAPGHSESSEELKSSQLMKLFEDQLKDMYWAENALLQAIPKMIGNASAPELIEALDNHLTETHLQVARLEEVFELLGKEATSKKCDAMAGLIKEGEGIMNECERGAMRDAGIIAAGQKIEHYEIASYGTLSQFAETLEMEDAVELLETTLQEEKAADETLTEVAVSVVNIQARDQDVEEEGENAEEGEETTEEEVDTESEENIK
ncbi:MAG TPA: ferritin-like domain-containing protein [Chitinophagales bacterium]|nr:ferritin-like domain-containing protein [Chitinophagales bacterium]